MRQSLRVRSGTFGKRGCGRRQLGRGIEGPAFPTPSERLKSASPARPGRIRRPRGAVANSAATVRATLVRRAATRPKSRVYAALDLGTNNCRLADRAAGAFLAGQRGRISRHQFLLPDRAAWRGPVANRPAQRRGDRTHHRRARRLQRQDRRARRHPRPLHRHRSLPGGRERRRVSRTARMRRRGSNSRSSIARPRRISPPPVRSSLADAAAASVVLFDIGGGSSEIVWLGQSAGQGAGQAATGLRSRPTPRCASASATGFRCKLGVVTLAEKFGGLEVSDATFEAMVDHVCRELAEFVEHGPRGAPLPQFSSARHVGHGDDDRRRLSRSFAL